MKNFPSRLYVFQTNEDDTVLWAVGNPAELAEVGKKQLVGVYVLTGTVEVEGTVSVTPKTEAAHVSEPTKKSK